MVGNQVGLGRAGSVEDNQDNDHAVDMDLAVADNLDSVVASALAAVGRPVFQVARELEAPGLKQFGQRKMLVEALEALHDSLVADLVVEDGVG